MEIRRMTLADIAMGYEDDRLIQITIKPNGADELGYEELMFAARQIQDFARREHRASFPRPASITLATGPRSVREMVAAYNDGKNGLSDEYLARLAAAYGDLAPMGRNVSVRLAAALGKPLQTVKGHISKARDAGLLSPAEPGKEGGEPTEKARQILADLSSPPS